MRLLFTGGGGAGSEAVFRLWRDRYDLHFADADPEAITPSIPPERRHRIPFARVDGFASDLAALCKALEIDTLIPGVDEELPHMPAVAEKAKGVSVLVPEPDYVATMLDKQATATALSEHGLPAPCTRPLEKAHEVGFPSLAKPRFGRGSRGVRIIENREQAAALARLENEEFVAQELLTGQEYTVMLAADRERRLCAVVPVKVLVKRGITLRAETEDQPAVVAACRAIHEAIPAAGCYNVQLMLTEEGQVMPFEINPRISTTFCLALAAGIDPVSIYFNNKGGDYQPFTVGLRLSRTWNNHIVRHAVGP